jgi:hypothetical protein
MPYIGNSVQNQGFAPAIDYFNGNGVTVTFTLSRPLASVAQIICAIDNVIQNPSSAFTVSGNSITFTSAPLSGTNNIWVEYTSLITTYAAISQDPSVIGDITASGGYLATGDFGNSYIDGTIVDYVTGNARITTGPVDDMTFYHGGSSARSEMMSLYYAGGAKVYGTTALTIPVGTTAERPTGATGMIRMNSTTGFPEWYSSATSAWIPFSDSIPYSIDVLVVAGGGGGGGGQVSQEGGGGGGAGGYLSYTSQTVTPASTYTTTVGAGGAGAAASSGATTGVQGSNSSFGSLTAAVGGGGGTTYATNGGAGGSGGGGQDGTTGGAGTSGQGNAGGTGNATYSAGGGGGGASAVGETPSTDKGGNGGAGTAWLNSTTYAGGGGGSVRSAGGAAGTGGAGGGADGTKNTTGSANSGTANTGGGGGAGCAGGSTGSNGGAGGSGVVIVRYSGGQKGTGGTVTSAGGYTYHTFTSSGTYTA